MLEPANQLDGFHGKFKPTFKTRGIKMNLKDVHRVGYIAKIGKAPVKNWKQEPGNISKALMAAFHYAKRDNTEMAVISGNSYMAKVFHIVPIIKPLPTPTTNIKIHIVNPCGVILTATAP